VKDLRIVARVYNNQLRERREATGLGACAFAEKIGIEASVYCAYESLKYDPITTGRGPFGTVRAKRWKKSAEVIASALGVDPDVIFPDAVREIARTTSEVRVDVAELKAIASDGDSPFCLLASGEETKAVRDALRVLSEREAEVIKGRFYEGKTYAEVGEGLCVHGERARQIERKALGKIRKHVADKGIE
jgi:RNA polymerase sigma factor (sigma-70 family)